MLCFALVKVLLLSSKEQVLLTHVWCSLWSHWGFTQSHCLSWWLFNPRLTGNHLHNQDAWYCEKWRLKHPLAQQDVLCFQQSDGPNWTISSSMETGYSFRLTVCSSLEHRNPYIYIYVYNIYKIMLPLRTDLKGSSPIMKISFFFWSHYFE